VRDRADAPASLREAAMIAPLEIRAAARRALAENGALTEDEMITAIARLLGFQRTGPDLRARIGGVVSALRADGVLAERGGALRPA
jgi:hypothetical protein